MTAFRRMLPLIALAPFVLPAQAADPPPGALTCGGCHPVDSRVGSPILPLAGRPAEEIVATLAAYRKHSKPSTIMDRILSGLSDEEVRAIAEWYAAPH